MKEKRSYLYFSIVFIQFWCAMGYYGTQTLLVLYLLHNFHFSISQSYIIYGGFVALLYTLPSLGGFIADRFLGSLYTFLFGSVLGIVGNFLLSIHGNFTFAAGLAFLTLGAGLAKSNSLGLTGFLYQDNIVRKEKAYRFLYMMVNAGATLGPLLYGVFAYSWGWNKGFLVSGTGLFIATLMFFILARKAKIDIPMPKVHRRNRNLIFLVLLPVIVLMTLLFYFPSVLNPLVSTLFIISLLYFVIIIFKETGIARKHLLILLTLSFFAMFYYIAGMQVGSTIAVFIQKKINLGEIKFDLPASVFASLYTVLIIAFTPAVNWFWGFLEGKRISITLFHKLSLGIAFGGFGLISFALASLTPVPLKFIVMGIALLSLGELVLVPTIYTALSSYSPPHLKTSMMGCWLLFVALGGYLSSVFTRLSLHIAVHQVNTDFYVFFMNGILVMVGALVLYGLRKRLVF